MENSSRQHLNQLIKPSSTSDRTVRHRVPLEVRHWKGLDTASVESLLKMFN